MGRVFEIAQELNPAIEPRTERNAAVSAVNQVVLALRYSDATGALLHLDKSICICGNRMILSNSEPRCLKNMQILELACCATDFVIEGLS